MAGYERRRRNSRVAYSYWLADVCQNAGSKLWDFWGAACETVRRCVHVQDIHCRIKCSTHSGGQAVVACTLLWVVSCISKVWTHGEEQLKVHKQHKNNTLSAITLLTSACLESKG